MSGLKTLERIARIVYYNLIPIIIGAFLFSSFGMVKDVNDFIHKMIIFSIYIIPLSIIYVWIGDSLIFPNIFPIDTAAYRLMLKMKNCEIRKKNGYDYCFKCQDSYTCVDSTGTCVGNKSKLK